MVYSLYLGLMPRPYKRLVKNNIFFSVNLKRKKSTSSSSDEDKEVKPPSASDPATAGLSDGCHEDDIGKFIGLATTMTVDKKNIFWKMDGYLRRITILRQMPNISRGNSITNGWKHIHHG